MTRGAAVSAQTSIGAQARIIGVLTAASRVAGFGRMLVFAACVGASAVGAAYQSANTIPNVVFEVAAGGILAAVVVPLLARPLERGERQDADRITAALLTWTLTVLVPLAVLVGVAAPWIAQALFDDPQSVLLGTRMLRVFAPQIVLYGLGIVVTGVLNAQHRFTAAALAPLVSSVVVIATYLTYGWLSRDAAPGESAIDVLAWGTTLGVLALVLTLVPSARDIGLRWRPSWRFPPGVAARARRLAGAGLLALVAQQVCVVTVLWLTNNRAAPGSINGYQYVQAIYVLPYAVLAVPLATAAFPVLAAAQGRGGGAALTLSRTARQIVVLTGLAATVLALAATDLGVFCAAIDAGRDGAGAAALAALPETMRAFAPGLIGLGLSALLTRALYVRGSAWGASGVMAAGWLIAAALPLALAGSSQDTGRTLGLLGTWSSIAMTLAACGLLLLTRRAWGVAAVAGLARVLAAAGVAAILAALFGDWLRALLPAATSAAQAVGAGALCALAAGSAYLGWMWALDRAALRLVLARGGDSVGENAAPGVTQDPAAPRLSQQ